MKAKIGIENKNVWLRIILGGLLVLAAGILLFAGTSTPVEAADVLKLKSDELLIVKQNNCALAIPKVTAKQVKVTCTAFTPVASSAQKVNDADESKVKRKLNAGDVLKVQASSDCKLVVKKNKATRVKVLCKPVITPPPPPSGPDGHWSGDTSQGKRVSFNVTGNETGFNSFKVQVNVNNCSGEITTPDGAILNGEMRAGGDLAGGTVFWDGTFTSNTALTGTWEASNVSIPGCGTWNESGSWTAHWSARAGAESGASIGRNSAMQFHLLGR